MTLNEREAHCLARLLQGALFGKSATDGCCYCKVRCGETMLAGSIRKRLTAETGVDLEAFNSGVLPMSDFPHGRFLKNAHEDAKKHYREMLKEFRDI